MDSNIVTVMQKSILFRGIGIEFLNKFADHCQLKSFKKGQEIFAMGDTADAFFIIVDGWVKLYRTSREGEETIIHVFGHGESFAEAAVFNDPNIYPVSAQTLEDTKLILIPRSFFIQNIEADSMFALSFIGAISAHQHYLVQQLEQVTTRTAPQRIGAFILRFCRRNLDSNDGSMIVTLPYNKSVIATRLNIQPETFSRALSKLEPYGVIVENKNIIITQLDVLTEFCDFSYECKPC